MKTELTKIKALIDSHEDLIDGIRVYADIDIWSEAKKAYDSIVKESDSLPCVSGSSFDWDKFAKALNDKFGESLINADDADENNPYDYWLQDVTVADIVDFCKNYR
jgi:hypothetical protein